MEETSPESVRRSRASLRALVLFAAASCVLQFAFAVLGIPRGLTSWLKCDSVQKQENPQWIIILGGSGIPSSTSLMRTYYGAYCALAHPAARCIVALPSKPDLSANSTKRMQNELVIRGVRSGRIEMEQRGMNTHEQAANIARMVGPKGRRSPVILVTSPYHMRRAYHCFRKEGFEQVGVLPTQSVSSEQDFRHAIEAWSGFGSFRSFLGHLRYGFWINLNAEVWIARELIGLTAYKIRGWI